MSTAGGSDRETILAVVARFEAAQAELGELSFDVLTAAEVLTIMGRLETVYRRQPAVDHQLLHHLTTQASPTELGGTNWANVVSSALRIGRGEARRRLEDAEDLGPRAALSGEPLTPVRAQTAQAQAAGAIGAEHVRIIAKFFAQLPDAVDYATREAAEATLARIASEYGPAELRQAAERLLGYLHPDGDYSDAERARRRGVTLGKQGPDGMSSLSGWLDPQARATLEAVFAKLAAPGMCNPQDDTPCVDATPSEAAIAADTRSAAQRHHDALTAMGRSVLASGELGQHNGLPVSIIVSTTLKELQSGGGPAVTGGGTLLPMSDVIRLARHAYHYLAVFDHHTSQPLYLGRSKRIASPAQRIVLYAKDRGCTRPGCTVAGYYCEVHHATKDWVHGGQTNITDLTLACPPDHRLTQDGGWKTRKRHDGRTEWIPPPHLDTGQPRVNDFHHPENYLIDPEDDEEEDEE